MKTENLFLETASSRSTSTCSASYFHFTVFSFSCFWFLDSRKIHLNLRSDGNVAMVDNQFSSLWTVQLPAFLRPPTHLLEEEGLRIMTSFLDTVSPEQESRTHCHLWRFFLPGWDFNLDPAGTSRFIYWFLSQSH